MTVGPASRAGPGVPLGSRHLPHRCRSARGTYLADGNLTLLTNQGKAGKTTLLSHLLHRLKRGGELAGLAVRAGKAAVVSEESAELWLERCRRFNFRKHVFPKTHPVSLGRVLERCVERGELKRDGDGFRSDPYRYWLPELEERWEEDIVAQVQQRVADAQREVNKRLGGL